MPDGTPYALNVLEGGPREEAGALLAFVADGQTEAVLRDGLADAGCSRIEIARGGAQAAAAVLSRSASPRVLIVDVAGEADPIGALDALAALAEPSVAVLVIGDQQDMDFYREVTRGLGVAEYLAKPLVRDRVTRLFGPVVRGQGQSVVSVTGGRSVAVSGANGGAGATTIAVNLAWYLASVHRRHTCLLDADLHLGAAALMMDAGLGNGLRSALQAPDRVDTVFLERAVEMVTDDAVDGRLALLASEAPLSEPVEYTPGAAATLLEVMRRRFNAVVADVAISDGPFGRELLAAVTQRVVVLEPTLASLRGAKRLIDQSGDAGQSRRPTLVLNRLGRPGGLPRKQIEQTLGKAADVVIPELTGKLIDAANLGKPLVGRAGPFRTGIEGLARQLGLAAAGSGAGRVQKGGWFGRRRP